MRETSQPTEQPWESPPAAAADGTSTFAERLERRDEDAGGEADDRASRAGFRERLRKGEAEESPDEPSEGVSERTALSEYPELREQVTRGLERTREAIERWDPEDRANAEEWFGSSSDQVRDHLRNVYQRISKNMDRVELHPFETDQMADSQGVFAYVYPEQGLDGGALKVHVGEPFHHAEAPPDTKAGILVHEVSHFVDVADTGDDDESYGQEGSRHLAQTSPELALRTADNIEYFFEAYTTEEPHSEG
jgi:hypothetical protein